MRNHFVGFGVRGSGFGVVLLLSAYCLVLSASVAVHAETLRDPFTFGPQAREVEAPERVLIGVSWDEEQPLAIVGDQTLRLGDYVADWKIVAIEKHGMAIERDGRRVFLEPGGRVPTQ